MNENFATKSKPMEKWYKNDLLIMTFGAALPLMNFYENFIVKDEKIFLGTLKVKRESGLPAEVGINLVQAYIETVKTPMGLLMQVRANFYSYGKVAINWLNYIHFQYPGLDFYLQYKDLDMTTIGEMYTKGPTDENGDTFDEPKITHSENELQWYDLDTKILMDRLEHYSIQETRLF